ncbi:hypothetical protein FQR65_LT16125 [Abscondita terminalis]|nr:hypothetical protein FQR65_LT16125 [Abscondita terminalis]
MTDTCFLCKSQINNLFSTNCNVDFNFTKCTNRLLRSYISDIFHNKILVVKNSLICNNCKNLIDDLDYAESSYKEIRNTVWNYLGYNDKKCNVYCQTSNDNNQERIRLECDLCLINFETEVAFYAHKKLHTGVINIKKEQYENGIQKHIDVVDINKDQILPVDTSIKLAHNTLSSTELNNKNECAVNSITVNTTGRTKKQSGVLKPYQCDVCAKTWKTSGELKSHQSSHSNVRPFICEICGQSYKQKTALDVHVGMHNGIYPFSCMYCKKTFTQKGALQRHLPLHTGDTPYQCDLCGKRFVHHTSFNIHRLSHTGQKDYKCSQCGLALLSASHLKRHMRVHTGEKKYACNLCDKRFAERYNLVSHQKLHIKSTEAYKRNHRCPLCPGNFNRRVKLNEHMVQEHQKIV